MHSKLMTESMKMTEVLEELKGEFLEEVKKRKREKSEIVRNYK